MTAKVNILMAFPFFKQNIVDQLSNTPRDRYDLIVDSGAFSAWNSGKEVKLKDYCEFLNSIKHLEPFHAVQLDVVGNPKESFKNYMTMKDMGFNIMPVFTRGESIGKLDEFYAMTDYVMFGGIAYGEKNSNYVKYVLSRNGKRKIHLLGFSDINFIKYYRPTSVDSSSWCSMGMYGNISIYNGYGELKAINKNLFTDKVKAISYAKKLKSSIGIEPHEFERLINKDAWIKWREDPFNSNEVYGLAQFIGTMSYLKRAYDVEKKLGTKMYMAFTDKVQLNILLNATRELENRNKLN